MTDTPTAQTLVAAPTIAHDAAVHAASGSVLQHAAWGDFKSRHDWDVIRAAGDNFAIQVLLKWRYGVIIGYVPRGPAVNWADADAVAACIKAMDRLCQRSNVALVLVEPDAALPPGFAAQRYGLTLSNLSVQPRRTIIVPCDKSDEALLAAMKQKTRYNVNLAARRGVTVRIGGADDLPAFWSLLETTAARDTFGVHTPEYYADLLVAFPPPHAGALLCAEYEGQIVAAALLIRGGTTAIYLAGASSDTSREHMPTYALQYAAMRWARDVGCTHYDLWGIPPTDEPPANAQGEQQNVRDGLWGVYRFKQGFGGEVVAYPAMYQKFYRPLLAPFILLGLNKRRGMLA